MYLQSAPCTGGVEKKRVSAKLYLPSLQAPGFRVQDLGVPLGGSHCLCRCRPALQVKGCLPGHHFPPCRHQSAQG